MDHDRYLIYSLKGKVVSFDGIGKEITGVVRDVYRNVLDGRIEIEVGNDRVHVREPDRIFQAKDGAVVLEYGHLGSGDEDGMLFALLREKGGGDIGELLLGLEEEGCGCVVVRILGEGEYRRRKAGRSKAMSLPTVTVNGVANAYPLKGVLCKGKHGMRGRVKHEKLEFVNSGLLVNRQE